MNPETPYKPEKVRKSKWKIVTLSTIIFGTIAISTVIILIVSPDLFVNKYLKEQVEMEFAEAYPDYILYMSDLNINLLNGHIELGDVHINAKDSSFLCSIGKPSARGINWFKLLWADTLNMSALKGISAEANSIDVKLKKTLYEIRCHKFKVSMRDSLVIFDSLKIHPIVDDNAFFDECEFRKTRYIMSLPQVKIKGLSFFQQLHGKSFRASTLYMHDASLNVLVNMYKECDPDSTKNSSTSKFLASLSDKIQIDSFNIENTNVQYGECSERDSLPKDGYRFHCAIVHASVQDSTAVAYDYRIDPLLEENEFFDASKFRRTRVAFLLPQLSVYGIQYSGLLKGERFQARYIQAQDPEVGIYVSMYKKSDQDVKSKIPMPNEIMYNVEQIVQVDSVEALNGYIKYGEYYQPRSKPAPITFTNMNAMIRNVSNNNGRGDTMVISLNSEFMDGGKLTLQLSTPLTTPKFCFRASGNLSPIKLSKFNTFLEIAEHVQLTSGFVQSSFFNLMVDDGKARGTVGVEYRDFHLSFLDKQTKSGDGVFNIIKSFLANTFKFNGSNERDKNGNLKLGKIRYTRKPGDTFIQVVWFSVRSGVADVIGFPQKN
ncbi:MAG: hypothetical protein HYZ54_05590 [Ignavibacteriae bacterium]|nr:hypothetical protein [Ignavibacteriota bacterium]